MSLCVSVTLTVCECAIVLLSSTWFKQGRKVVGEDLLPESRTWSKEEIMGAKTSRDWLSNWSLGLIGK